MPGLASSRWAPRLATTTYYSSISDRPPRLNTNTTITSTTTTTNSTTTTSITHPHQIPIANNTPQSAQPSRSSVDELARYTKIVRRLKWKLPHLASGYQQSISRLGRDPADVAEAELMFKLDFFEYYMLLERALVHLLGVFGRRVSSGRHLADSRWNDTNEGGGVAGKRYNHRYHALVLEALDDEANPLHGVLGTGEVRRQLARAKDLRNRWKNADDGDTGSVGKGGGNGNRNGKVAAPLECYDVEHILTVIFEGFDRAFVVAEEFVREQMQVKGHARGASIGSSHDVDMVCDGAVGLAFTDEEQWEFMVDAMDWEAV